MLILIGVLLEPDKAQPDTPSLGGVLHRVGKEVDEDLVDPHLVPHQILVPDARHLQMECLPLGPGHGLDDGVHRGDHVVKGKFLQVQHHLAALDLGYVQDVVDKAQEVLAGGHDLPCVFPDLGGVPRLVAQERREAQDRVHRRADIVGHVGKEGGLGLAGDLGGLQSLGQLLAVEPALRLPLPPELILLPAAQIVQADAQEKGRQHGDHDDDDVLTDRPPLLLDGLHGHIAHQEDRPAVHRPHVVEGLDVPDIVIEKDVLPALQAGLHLFVYLRVLDTVGPVEIAEVQVSRVPLPHPLGLEDEAAALRVHDIQRRLFVVEAVRQGPVHGIVDILGVERPDLHSVPGHGTLDRIGPGPHIIEVGLGHRQPHDGASR